MLVEKIDHIETHQEILRFETHISQKDNKRIIFSAPYGSGKTYFLEKFFEKFSGAYNPVFINPVKYSVSDNKDIFELVKVDIILQCLERGYLKATKSVSDFDKVSNEWFIKDNAITILAALAKAIPNISTFDPASLVANVVISLPEIKKLHKEYIKQKASELKTTEEKLTAFITQFTETKGTIYEQDEVTYLLRELIKKAKEDKNTKKQSVLIIDDFDRLDPEHIFRILNVLSVHNDSLYTDNKFGFDKIIIVCDIDGLEKIFKHRYGPAANFEGYMDKFCSTHYYQFNIENEIHSFLENQFNKQIGNANDSDGMLQLELMTVILAYFVKNGTLTMRKLVKTNFDFELPNHVIIKAQTHEWGWGRQMHIASNEVFIDTNSVPFFRTLKLLSAVWGSFQSFQRVVLETSTGDNINLSLTEDVVRPLISSLALAKLIGVSQMPSELIRHRVDDHTATEHPQVVVFGRKVTIPLGYYRADPYTGQESLFTKAKVSYDMTPRNSGVVSYLTLFRELSGIISGFKQRGYLDKFDFVH